MNRRQFFGMTALAVAAAGLPAIVLPDRKIFLPPRGGWGFSMREVEQYLINTDSMAMRWDVGWITRNGEYAQYYVLQEDFPVYSSGSMDSSPLKHTPQIVEDLREIAREKISREIPWGARIVQLKLPKSVRGAYV